MVQRATDNDTRTPGPSDTRFLGHPAPRILGEAEEAAYRGPAASRSVISSSMLIAAPAR